MKPIVHYRDYKDLTRPEIGHQVILLPIDHPSSQVSNTREALTSPVVNMDDYMVDGTFETRNTIYKRAK